MDRQKAEGYLAQGFNCSQTVLLYFSEKLGLDNDIAVKISQAFESGLFKGDTCGALSGAFMVIGLAKGDGKNRGEIKGYTDRFRIEFEKKMASTKCEDLLGINITKDEDLKKAYDEGIIARICPEAIFTAIEILENILD